MQQKRILFSFPCTSLECKNACRENDFPLNLMKGTISLFCHFFFQFHKFNYLLFSCKSPSELKRADVKSVNKKKEN